MEKFIKYPSIEQFRHIVKNVQLSAKFKGLDDEGKPIYDETATMPVLKLKGTEKIHGTNAGVCKDIDTGEIWCQSRKNIITAEKDNAGFAFFVESRKELFKEYFDIIQDNYNLEENSIISIYGEFAGGNIQKNSCFSDLEKRFVIFDIKVTKKDNEDDVCWLELDSIESDEEKLVFNINDFPSYEIEVDFSQPLLSQNKMIAMVDEIEKCSPMGDSFKKENIGEGIVFKAKWKDMFLKFKVKGDKHSKSKVKKLPKVDNEKLNKMSEIAKKVTPEWRLDQMYTETFDTINGGKGDIKKTGDYIRSVIRDIMKEDIDLIVESGLEPKDINKDVSIIARKYLMERLDSEVMQ